MLAKTYCGKINEKFRNKKIDIPIPTINIPEEVPLVLKEVAEDIISQYNTELRTIREDLQKRRLIALGDPCRLAKETVGLGGWRYLDLDEDIVIETRIAIPEFTISLRGKREGDIYDVQNLMLINSHTEYKEHNCGKYIPGFWMMCEEYDSKTFPSEILRGHFHPPIPRPDHLTHIIAESDLGNCPTGDIEVLFSMELDCATPELSFFKRISDRTIVKLPYLLTSNNSITHYLPKVKIQQKQLNKSYRSYESIVEFILDKSK